MIITNCILTGNTAPEGGAISCDNDSSPTIINCLITGNTARFNGGAVSTRHESTPTFINCTITGNAAGLDGGAVYLGAALVADATFINCTIADNSARRDGGGVFTHGFMTRPTVTNSIIWGNSGDQISGPGAISVRFSDVQGGFVGQGNIDDDPLFPDPANGDYSLAPGSPVIDAADNTAVPPGVTTDLVGNPRFVDDPATPDTGNGAPPIVDMGAYEFQVGGCAGDLDGDGDTDLADLGILLADFGCAVPGPCVGDLDGDGDTDLADLGILLADFGCAPWASRRHRHAPKLRRATTPTASSR